MGARIKKQRKRTRKIKIEEGCRSARTPKKLIDELNKMIKEDKN